MGREDLEFRENRGWTAGAWIGGGWTVRGHGGEDAYLVKFQINPNDTMAHFVLATFADGALDIKLSETTLRGKVDVLENPYRVQVWNAVDESASSLYRMAEFTLPSPNASKLGKTGETIVSRGP